MGKGGGRPPEGEEMAAAVPLPRRARSPANSVRSLRCTISQIDCLGGEGRMWGTRSRPRRDRGEPAQPAPWPAAMELAGVCRKQP